MRWLAAARAPAAEGDVANVSLDEFDIAILAIDGLPGDLFLFASCMAVYTKLAPACLTVFMTVHYHRSMACLSSLVTTNS